MRGKLLLFLILLVMPLSSLPAASWSIGLGAGPVIGGVAASTGYREDTRYTLSYAYNVSIPVGIYFDNGLGIETGLRLTDRSYRYVHGYQGEDSLDIHEHNAYIELPLMMTGSWRAGRSAFSLGAGAYIGVLAYKRECGSFHTPSTRQDFEDIIVEYDSWKDIDSTDMRFEAGLSVKLSAAFRLAGGLDIFIEGRGDFALTPTDRRYQDGQAMRYNMHGVISAGLAYTFGGRQ